MAEIDIVREDHDRDGRWVGRIPGVEEIAELVYEKLGPGRIVAVHTLVPDTMRGTGMGRALVDRLVADARAEGFTVVPQCPFVHALRLRHPEWADVMPDVEPRTRG